MTRRRNSISIVYLLFVLTVPGFPYTQSCSRIRFDHQSIWMNSWLGKSIDQFGKFLNDLSNTGRPLATADKEENIPKNQRMRSNKNETASKIGRILRTASRAYDKDSSKPSSRLYTTRKDAQIMITMEALGVEGDYNHYRTVALQSTTDRAVSILTTDSMKFLRSLYPSAQDGDLGENLYVDGVAHTSFHVGGAVSIGDEVVLEITEPIEPCANLCKLPYINDDYRSPKQRIEECQTFIERLDSSDGLRGWYAKVLQSGNVRVGDILRLL